MQRFYQITRSLSRSTRCFSTTPAQPIDQTIHSKLTSALSPVHLSIEDTSGGCGAFFRINVVSDAFAGKSLVKQHRMVKDAIATEISAVHGVTINTMTNEQFNKLKQ